jgi:hypothetical protein
MPLDGATIDALPIPEWLIGEECGALDDAGLIAGLGERLRAMGLPLDRLGLYLRTLHPEYFGRALAWAPGEPVESENRGYGITALRAYAESPVRRAMKSVSGRINSSASPRSAKALGTVRPASRRSRRTGDRQPFGYDTSRFPSFSSVLPPSAGVPATSGIGNAQFWLLLDQMLVRNGSLGGDQDGLYALGGYVHNNPANSTYATQYFAALVDRDFWHARPEDTIGLLFTYIGMSGTLAAVQAEQLALGLPLSNQATAPQGHEMILEADYSIHVFRGVHFRPDFQYVIHPNAQSNIKNAVVLGFKFNVSF